jgi:hypothetical protein
LSIFDQKLQFVHHFVCESYLVLLVGHSQSFLEDEQTPFFEGFDSVYVLPVLVLDLVESTMKRVFSYELHESPITRMLSKSLDNSLDLFPMLALALGQLSESQALVLRPEFPPHGRSRQLRLSGKLLR